MTISSWELGNQVIWGGADGGYVQSAFNPSSVRCRLSRSAAGFRACGFEGDMRSRKRKGSQSSPKDGTRAVSAYSLGWADDTEK